MMKLTPAGNPALFFRLGVAIVLGWLLAFGAKANEIPTPKVGCTRTNSRRKANDPAMPAAKRAPDNAEAREDVIFASKANTSITTSL